MWEKCYMAGRIHLRWAAPSERSGRTLKEAEQIGGSAKLQAGREREREREGCRLTETVTHKWHEIRRRYVSRLSVERRHILVTNLLSKETANGENGCRLESSFSKQVLPCADSSLATGKPALQVEGGK